VQHSLVPTGIPAAQSSNVGATRLALPTHQCARARHPARATRYAPSGTCNPVRASRYAPPVKRLPPSTCHPARAKQYTPPSTRHPADPIRQATPGTRHPVRATRYSPPGARHPACATRRAPPDTRQLAGWRVPPCRTHCCVHRVVYTLALTIAGGAYRVARTGWHTGDRMLGARAGRRPHIDINFI